MACWFSFCPTMTFAGCSQGGHSSTPLAGLWLRSLWREKVLREDGAGSPSAISSSAGPAGIGKMKLEKGPSHLSPCPQGLRKLQSPRTFSLLVSGEQAWSLFSCCSSLPSPCLAADFYAKWVWNDDRTEVTCSWHRDSYECSKCKALEDKSWNNG